jgi:hypothetical protein
MKGKYDATDLNFDGVNAPLVYDLDFRIAKSSIPFSISI